MTSPPGWYLNPSGEPGTRYWDGRQWTDRYLPRRQHNVLVLLAMTIVVVGVALIFFAFGAQDYHRYAAGTPTTATITECFHPGSKGGYCRATWTIGGVTQTGKIIGGPFDHIDRVGATVDVRVNNGHAYTANSLTYSFVLGGGVLVIGLILVFAMGILFRRRRNGR